MRPARAVLVVLAAAVTLPSLLPAPLSARQTGARSVAGLSGPGASPGAAGQDAPAVDDETAEPVTQERAEQDARIRSRLQAIYDRIEALDQVSVEVEAGIVRLEGRALSLEAREQAVELARDTEGVVFVDDRLRVVTDLGRRLEPALERIREYGIGALAFVPLLAVALFIVVAFGLLGRWVAGLEGPHLRFARTPFIRGLVQQAVRVVVTLIGLLVALELLDATALVGAVLGTAGVFGLALGFAFRDIVENHLAGIMLSLRQPFAPNDHIVVGSHEGKVVRLTARETILMTLAGNHVRVPNAEIFRSVITNYTRNPRRRFDFPVSVGTDDDLVAAQEVGLSALRDMEGVMGEPPPRSTVRELGDSWVMLDFFGWVDQESADFARVRSEAIRLVKQALEDAGVTMPSPEYGVVLQEAASSGPEPEAPPERTPPPEPPGQRDVSVDRALDEQIEEDRRLSDEPDLLEGDSLEGS